jgi:nitrilase
MTVMRSVRVAAVQATPEILDAEGSVAKAARLLGEAADAGAELAVLPECFISVYPSNAWAKASASFGGSDELWERLWLSSVDVPGPLIDELVEVCRARGMHAVIGVNERESERPGTIYNAMVTLGPSGLLHKHRKLMPTQHERLFHGIGPGDDLRVCDTAAGRVGGLICWENRMPLARYAMYRQGPQIWVAPTADDSDGWVAHMRAIAIESGAFVVSVPQYIPRSAFPDDFPCRPRVTGGVRSRGRGDRRADLGRCRGGSPVRRGGNAAARLRPARRPAREALVRLGGALQPGGRAGPRRAGGGRSSRQRTRRFRRARVGVPPAHRSVR